METSRGVNVSHLGLWIGVLHLEGWVSGHFGPWGLTCLENQAFMPEKMMFMDPYACLFSSANGCVESTHRPLSGKRIAQNQIFECRMESPTEYGITKTIFQTQFIHAGANTGLSLIDSSPVAELVSEWAGAETSKHPPQTASDTRVLSHNQRVQHGLSQSTGFGCVWMFWW